MCMHLKREFSFRACSEDNTAAVSHNRDLANVLVGAELQRDHTYFYENYRNPAAENTVYKNKLISLSINELYYKDSDSIGVTYGEFFGDQDAGIPLPVIALVVTAMRYAIDEWQTGVRRGGRRGLKFRWKRYHLIYKFHMEQLTTWSTAYARSGHCLAYQKALFASAREHAGVTISTVDEDPEVEEQGLDASVFGVV
ncbi:hypothetical protein PHLGIDRAFT_123741 [Phlebiopsis gigantea 11061_1 CR5-6]|uniref:DUF6532 domain-containing protein n=1 Tax=Phlebiopsis gigantea (strain 11061_1 CR5-6) TaxID=745531 RepID=A0A0C3N978_PHLG1|nr:hypothetical protein PHLGIDRAFT_123741 [Phlebiopsis gigantea 11061_1 CR5-6]